MINLKATVSIALPLKKDTNESFPLSLGALTLTSKEGNRSFILDSISTNYENPCKKGENLTIESTCEIDLETFPEDEETPYSLNENDLKDCSGLFYCSDVDNEDGEDCFDYSKAIATATITNTDTGEEFTINISLEV